MKHTPLLFSAMLAAKNVDGSKTQTRRIINPNSSEMIALMMKLECGIEIEQTKQELLRCHCRYGGIGDIIWQREKFKLIRWNYDDTEVTFQYHDEQVTHNFEDADDTCQWIIDEVYKLEKLGVLKAVWPEDNEESDEDDMHYVFTDKEQSWRPSIFLPKWAARFWAELTDVRIQRIADITEDDCTAEGIEDLTDGKKLSFKDYSGGQHPLTAKASYRSLWNKINGAPSPIQHKENGKTITTGYISYPFDENSINEIFNGGKLGIAENGFKYRGLPLQIITNPWVWSLAYKSIPKPENW